MAQPATAYALVATAAKSLAAFTGKHNHPDIGALTAVVHRLNHLLHGFGSKGIVHMWPVDADAGYALKLMKQNFFKLSDWLPVVF